MHRVLFFVGCLLTLQTLAFDAEIGAFHAAKGDFKTAYNIWRVSAEGGDAMSQYYLGVLYERGNGIEQSYSKALFWYLKAANQGIARAHYNIGNMFFQGKGMSVDYGEAARRFRLAADLGYAPAQYNLAYIFERGLNGHKDMKKAFTWYLKAAENGLAEAMLQVAAFYENGQGIRQDKSRAIYWYGKVANKDNKAKVHLARLNLEDPATRKQGLQLLREAAEDGDPLAQFELGYQYGQGKHVRQDYEQAVFWYKRAAKQQVPDAQYLLCLSYSLGKGVPVDIILAHVWCEAAAKNGAEGAAEALRTIRESMTVSQRKAARKVAPVLNPQR